VKQNWLVYLVIFSLALNLGTIGTFAYLRYQDQQERAARQARPPLPLRSLWRQLDLNNSQRQSMHRRFPAHRRKVHEIRRELAQKRQELYNLIQDNSTPMPAIQDKVQEISALQGSLELEMVRFMLALKKILTPPQQAVFLRVVQTHLCRPGGPCGRRGPGCRGHRRGPGPGFAPGPPGPGSGDRPPPGYPR
jgi:Spy/CpxP family protein refolding chaperone